MHSHGVLKYMAQSVPPEPVTDTGGNFVESSWSAKLMLKLCKQCKKGVWCCGVCDGSCRADSTVQARSRANVHRFCLFDLLHGE